MASNVTEIYEAISYILLNDNAVKAIVGTKVFSGWRPTTNAAAPCINHFEITASKHPFGVVSGCQLQVNCWAANYKAARQLSDAVSTALNHYGGLVNGQFHIDAIEYADRKDELPEPEVGLINIATFYNILYRGDN